jgi:DNA-binding beta-propeller fold protein YncE
MYMFCESILTITITLSQETAIVFVSILVTMNGKSIWRFEDTSVLRSPRGVVVDNQGFVFVAGEKSGSIVVISPDGNSVKCC